MVISSRSPSFLSRTTIVRLVFGITVGAVALSQDALALEVGPRDKKMVRLCTESKRRAMQGFAARKTLTSIGLLCILHTDTGSAPGNQIAHYLPDPRL